MGPGSLPKRAASGMTTMGSLLSEQHHWRNGDALGDRLEKEVKPLAA
jgi:hypothetical protein